jgi:hypothetical protein
MKTISLNVPPKIAQAFEQADAAVKQKAEIYINAWLDSFLSKQSPNQRLKSIMETATREAKSNGFTPDKLDDLLKDE